ncbi:MAG: universal stress protein [Gammaproteobacteria bacterium]|nr:MAG: universal stress protein [Gammaproteobacteria bacterium]
MNYKHILFVTDLQSDSPKIAEKVAEMLTTCPDAKLSVVHVVLDNIIAGGYEVMPLFNYADDKENIQENAKALKAFLKETTLHADNTEVVPALSTAGGIADYANENEVDLIVIGLHKRTGLLSGLLGNTASSVLNYANCDVLTVVLPEQAD